MDPHDPQDDTEGSEKVSGDAGPALPPAESSAVHTRVKQLSRDERDNRCEE